MMKNNGFGDKYNEYYNKLESYTGVYYWTSGGKVFDDPYLGVTTDEDEWKIIIKKTIIQEGETSDDDYLEYDFLFEKQEKYEKFYFEDNGVIKEKVSESYTSTYTKVS